MHVPHIHLRFAAVKTGISEFCIPLRHRPVHPGYFFYVPWIDLRQFHIDEPSPFPGHAFHQFHFIGSEQHRTEQPQQVFSPHRVVIEEQLLSPFAEQTHFDGIFHPAGDIGKDDRPFLMGKSDHLLILMGAQ